MSLGYVTLFKDFQHITFHQLCGCKGDIGRMSFWGKRCVTLFHFLKEDSEGFWLGWVFLLLGGG